MIITHLKLFVNTKNKKCAVKPRIKTRLGFMLPHIHHNKYSQISICKYYSLRFLQYNFANAKIRIPKRVVY